MPTINISKKYDENNISELVSKLSFIFRLKGKLVKGYEILISIENDYKKDFTAITTLLYYKFISFAIDEECLYNPSTNLDEKTPLFERYHLQDLIKSYLRHDDVDRLYAKIKPITHKDFFVAPHPISKIHFKNKDDLDSQYYKIIQDYYSNINPQIIDYIKTCLVEISSNFYYHAENDDKSILMAEGDNDKVEVISADTSVGIIETLRKKFPNESDTKILENAFKRSVSSKLEKNHCGTGLWLINEIVTKLKGKLIVHTNGYIYRNIQGNIRIFASSNWQGTILYLKLPITEVSEMEKFLIEILKNNTYVYAN